MAQPASFPQDKSQKKGSATFDRLLLAASILLQLLLGFFLGHAYDTRIFMMTGFLVGTGQNPYVAQDLSPVFHNPSFQGVTTIGYPPAWALVLGLIYLCSYKLIPDFLLYNLAIKLPIIAANICLAYAVKHILNKYGVQKEISRSAWIFLLFNPFLLLTSSAWGQIDPLVALFSLIALFLLAEGGLVVPAVLLALAISLKPIAIPLILVIFIYLASRSLRRTLRFFIVFTASMLLFCVVPFILFGWDPAPILLHWNNQFTVGGALSFMTFLEYTQWTYQLPAQWAFLGWLWVPALAIAAYAMKSGITGFEDLLKKSVALVLVFYLCRAWVSETNLNLVLPMVLILVSLNGLDRRALLAIWVVPLIFSFFNTSLAQLFFPSQPGLMNRLLQWSLEFSTIRYASRTVVVVAWLVAGWWIVSRCFKKIPRPSTIISA